MATLRSAHADAEAVLYSTYTGHDVIPELLISELADVGDREPELATRRLYTGGGALTYARRLVLYDHLARFAALVGEHTAHELRIGELDRARRALDPVAAF